ncbi:ATP-binding protein [Roseitranquillus sediminis]|uniref:ATP-binding protein n=1 Tax=Roseitranquillus sediminis TaxID=2809051 RepID=UPI001D0C98D8|nr:ATP-binding protein [Roseitranquillus sediminis]MBM9592982.1 HAMP domain-containing protein [Roseitranquillus sediminis]
MGFDWLKRWMPRSLYARAALILLAPVLTIQIVVSVVFIQRLYEDVTEQMTRNVLREVAFLVDEVREAPDRAAAEVRVAEVADPLEMSVDFVTEPTEGDTRLWYDLSGRIVIRSLRERLSDLQAVDLATTIRRVTVYLDTQHGLMAITFNRGRVSASNPHQLLVLMTFTSMLMTIIAYLFLRNQLRPVKRLAAAAEAFGRGRNLPYKPTGATEMRAAGSAFLDMRNRIERMIEQRTMMLSGVSHDLRTPLTRLKLGLSLIEESEETLAMQRDVADMERLLETFLEFARGAALDESRPMDTAVLARDAVENARRAGHSVTLGELDGDGRMVGSPLAVERALVNLIENAARYGTRVTVGMAASERAVRLSVEDDGPGIPAELRGEAIKPFARLDVSRNQDRGTGVGLGLAIAHDVARRHGGTLRLGESETLGGLRADLVLAR